MDVYEQLSLATGFDWDFGNIDKNWIKHRVALAECEQVFFNRPFVINPDPSHSLHEARFFALGSTAEGRYLFMVFTLRGPLIRVISARDMTRKERKVYEDL